MLKYNQIKQIDVDDWDNLVSQTYGKVYSFQQQDGCQDRGGVDIKIPTECDNNENMNESIEEAVNGDEMGVKFEAWLARDPKQPLASGEKEQWQIDMFWERNFYPDLQTVANDLFKKGLIEAGDYVIDIDW